MAYICDACHANGEMNLAPFLLGGSRSRATCEEHIAIVLRSLLTKQDEVIVRRGEWD